MPSLKAPIDLRRAETILLDMDGTLLDLAFDNLFWLQLVPLEYARVHRLAPTDAHARLRDMYLSVEGNLKWYCLDHWTETLGFGVRELKWTHRHLIGYLPGVPDVLRLLRLQGKRLLIVTNAHRDTLAVKLRQTRVDTFVDGIVSSHDYGYEKENRRFWERLSAEEPFDADKTVFFDDSESVLNAAASYGLANVVAIRRPDSGRPAREIDGLTSIDGIGELETTLRAC